MELRNPTALVLIGDSVSDDANYCFSYFNSVLYRKCLILYGLKRQHHLPGHKHTGARSALTQSGLSPVVIVLGLGFLFACAVFEPQRRGKARIKTS